MFEIKKWFALALFGSVAASGLAINTMIYEKDLEQYPSGLAIGGSLGKGYISTHESNNINDNLPTNAFSPIPSLSKGYDNGYLVWNAFAAYDFLFKKHMLTGVLVGYQSMGQSTGLANYSLPASSVAVSTQGATISYQYTNQQQAIDFLLTGRVYVSERCKGLHFIGKAGAAFVQAADRISFQGAVIAPSGVTASKNSSAHDTIWRIEPEFNLGVGYSLSRHLNAHVLYTYVGGTDGNTSTAASSATGDNIPWQGVFAYNAVTAGLSYSFN